MNRRWHQRRPLPRRHPGARPAASPPPPSRRTREFSSWPGDAVYPQPRRALDDESPVLVPSNRQQSPRLPPAPSLRIDRNHQVFASFDRSAYHCRTGTRRPHFHQPELEHAAHQPQDQPTVRLPRHRRVPAFARTAWGGSGWIHRALTGEYESVLATSLAARSTAGPHRDRSTMGTNSRTLGYRRGQHGRARPRECHAPSATPNAPRPTSRRETRTAGSSDVPGRTAAIRVHRSPPAPDRTVDRGHRCDQL